MTRARLLLAAGAIVVEAMLVALPLVVPAARAVPPAERNGSGVIGPNLLPAVRPAVYRGSLRGLPPPRAIPANLRPENDTPAMSLGGAQVPTEHLQAAMPLAPAPAPDLTFPGLDHDNWGDGWPPDTNGDVGPTHFVQSVNTSVGIFRKSDGQQLAAFTFNTLFAAGDSGTPCDTSNQGDPVVLYDQQADRWIISDFAWTDFAAGAMYQCFAISISGDPVDGGWYLYAIQTDAGGQIPDYPKLGVWPDGIYMSANVFDTTGLGSFQHVRVWAFNRSDFESGAPVRAVSFDLPSKIQGITVFSLLPSNLRGAAPPTGRPNLFASIWGIYAARVWQFHADWDDPLNSTFSGPGDVGIGTFAVGPITVPQREPGNQIDTLTYRLMMQNQYRNIAGAESLWLTHTVGNGGDPNIASVRWYELDVSGGVLDTNAPLQEGTFNPDDSYRFMPSLAVDGSGNMAVGYSVSDASMAPAIRYAGRLLNDPANTLGQGEMSLWEGTGVQSNICGGGPCERWGDYSTMTVDPVDDCTFWYTNQYYAADGGNWQTRIGSFSFPTCTGGPSPTPTPTPPPPPAPFTDIADSPFKTDIEWLYAEGVTTGCAPTLYCPDDPVTREQMASFLVRMFDLAASETDFFTDDEASIHEADINALAAAGVTVGCSATTFCPGVVVTRAQMASFLARAVGLTVGAGRNYFYDDDDDIHEANIDYVAAAGIATGCGEWRYCPAGPVTREQMAAFLHRVVEPVTPPPYPAPPPPATLPLPVVASVGLVAATRVRRRWSTARAAADRLVA